MSSDCIAIYNHLPLLVTENGRDVRKPMLEKVCLPVFVKFSTVALDYDLLIKEIMNTTVLVVDLSKIENSVLVLIFPFVSFVVLGHNVRKKVKCFRQFDITNACSIFLVRFGLEVKKKVCSEGPLCDGKLLLCIWAWFSITNKIVKTAQCCWICVTWQQLKREEFVGLAKRDFVDCGLEIGNDFIGIKNNLVTPSCTGAVNRLKCSKKPFSGTDGVSISEISVMLKSVLSAAARYKRCLIHFKSCYLWLQTLSKWNLLILRYLAEFNLISFVLVFCLLVELSMSGKRVILMVSKNVSKSAFITLSSRKLFC